MRKIKKPFVGNHVRRQENDIFKMLKEKFQPIILYPAFRKMIENEILKTCGVRDSEFVVSKSNE